MKAGLSLLAAALWLTLCLPAAATQTTGKRPAASAPRTATLHFKDAMIFYLARGEANACGPGCNEWIAAEGIIANGAADRLRGFLNSNSGKRPIYFYSPGGITAESFALGRLMREHGLTARVARTVPQGCEPDSKECTSARRDGREVAARLSSADARCDSACVYAIVGARTREIAPEVHLGVHATKVVFAGYLPKNVQIPAHLRARLKAEYQQSTRRYLVEMGIAPGLLDAAEKIPHGSLRALSRAEIVKFNIDTRSVAEGRAYDERIVDTGAVTPVDMTKAGGAE